MNFYTTAVFLGCILIPSVSFAYPSQQTKKNLNIPELRWYDEIKRRELLKLYNYDIYIPGFNQHNYGRWRIEHNREVRYNQKPWGLGLGVSFWDDKENLQSFYLIAIRDAYYHWRPFLGYEWQTLFRPISNKNFHLGIGYITGFSATNEWRYVPFPFILPVLSIGCGPSFVQMTYVPDYNNNGNTYFTWLRLQF